MLHYVHAYFQALGTLTSDPIVFAANAPLPRVFDTQPSSAYEPLAATVVSDVVTAVQFGCVEIVTGFAQQLLRPWHH